MANTQAPSEWKVALLFVCFVIAELLAMLVAGYLGLFKAPLQAALAIYANFQIWKDAGKEIDNTLPPPKSNFLKRIYNSKPVQKIVHYRQEKIEEIFHGNAKRAILSIILYVWALGLVFALIHWIFSDWRTVLSDEAREMAVLAFVLVFFLLLMLAIHESYRERVNQADDRFEDDDDPWDEKDMLQKAYTAMGKAGRYTGDMIEASLGHWIGLGALFVISVGCYLLGMRAHAASPVPFLETIRAWRL